MGDNGALGGIIQNEGRQSGRHGLDKSIFGGAEMVAVERIEEEVEARQCCRRVIRLPHHDNTFRMAHRGVGACRPAIRIECPEDGDLEVCPLHRIDNAKEVRAHLDEIDSAEIAAAQRRARLSPFRRIAEPEAAADDAEIARRRSSEQADV